MRNRVNKQVIKRLISSIIYFVLITILCIVVVQKISNNNLSFFGYRIFRVISESMSPKYNINDILLVKEVNIENIKIGDDISYLRKSKEENGLDKIITHQVVNIEKKHSGEIVFHTKGIANIVEDPLVNGKQIYGIVASKLYLLSIINKIINNVYGFILLVFIPLLLIIFKNIKELIIVVEEKKK